MSLTLTGGLCGHARAQTPPSPQVIDARRALPFLPTYNWKDGFLLETTGVPDLGLHARVTAWYMRNPLGSEATLSDRFTLHPSLDLSINKWVDIGLGLPILLWQDTSGFNLSRSAIGDLRMQSKLSLNFIPEAFPRVAVSIGVGFPTGSKESRIGAGQISFAPRLVIDWTTLKGRLTIYANIGAFLGGNGGSCDPTTQPLDPTDATKMKRLSCPMQCDPMMQPLDPMDPMKMKRLPCPNMSTEQSQSLSELLSGLGNHLIYGVGLGIHVSPEIGLRLITELVGSYASTVQSRSPLFWNVGLLRAKGNKWSFSAMYGTGLTTGSPSHTVMVTLGYAFEHKDPEKKENPKVEFIFPPGVQIKEMPKDGVPPGAAAPGAPPAVGAPPSAPGPAGPVQQYPPPVGGVGGPAQYPPAGGPGGPAQYPPAGGPGGPVQAPVGSAPVVQKPKEAPKEPPKPTSITVEVPDDWWPEKKEDKKK